MIDDVNPLCFCLGLASSDVNIFLLSFHFGWIIWGVGAGRKLLKCCGNCCDSMGDAGLLSDGFRVLRVYGGRHGGNSSVFQELEESLTCVKVQGP